MELRTDPGPLDPTVLTLQESHRSSAVWRGEANNVLTCRHHLSKLTLGWEIDDRILHYVREAGFFGVHRLGFMSLDRALITALVERWRQETHSFHLVVGEATITLQDVAVLMGLRVVGPAITGTSDQDWAALSEELLGVRPPPEVLSGSSLRHTWLRQHFSRLPQDANDVVIQCHARAYILVLLGGMLFADKTGGEIQLIYLQLLRDWETASKYSWGSATLAFLYRQLCRASQSKVQEIAGPLILVQLWSWEHLHIGRPTTIKRRRMVEQAQMEKGVEIALDNGQDQQQGQLPGDPLGCRWIYKGTTRADAPNGSLAYYRDALDHQRDDQICWQPCTSEILSTLPDICRANQHVWRTMAPLICFDIVEGHFPNRVMRQFGMKQDIPSPCDTAMALHKIDRRGRPQTDWSKKHHEYVTQWSKCEETVVTGEPLCEPMSWNDPYMLWYRRITRLLITPPTQPPPTHYQPTSSRLHTTAHALASVHTKCKGMLVQLRASRSIDLEEFLVDIEGLCTETLNQVGRGHLLDLASELVGVGERSTSGLIAPGSDSLALSPLKGEEDPLAMASLGPASDSTMPLPSIESESEAPMSLAEEEQPSECGQEGQILLVKKRQESIESDTKDQKTKRKR